MTTLVITEHFKPSNGATAQLITDLVVGLKSLNHDTIVLTSTPQSNQNPESNVIRLQHQSTVTTSIYYKALSGNIFLFKSFLWAVQNRMSFDNVLIVSNPPYSGIIGILLKLLLGKRYYFLFQDIFPRSAVLAGILPARGPLLFAINALMRLICEHSQCVILLSSDMQRRCQRDFGNNYNSTIISNWSIPKPVPFVSTQSSKLPNLNRLPILLQYSGNHGRLHDIITILEAARLLKDQPILFEFIGGGPKYHYAYHYIHRYNLSNVVRKPYQDRDSLEALISSSDASFVSLMPGAEDTIAPSKLYGILACSKPVILLSSPTSDLAQLVLSSNSGYVVEPGDVPAMVKLLISLVSCHNDLSAKSQSAYKLYMSSFQKQDSIAQYHTLLSTPPSRILP